MNAKISLAVALVALCSFAKDPVRPTVLPYKNASLPVDQRVADLIGRMTTEEKIKQLDMWWGRHT